MRPYQPDKNLCLLPGNCGAVGPRGLRRGSRLPFLDLSPFLPSSTGTRPRPARWASLGGMSAACQPPHTTLRCQAWVSRLLPFHHYLLLTARVAAQHEAHINNLTTETDILPPLTLLLHTVAAHSWNSNFEDVFAGFNKGTISSDESSFKETDVKYLKCRFPTL